MRQISLSQGKVVILDDDDFERLSAYHWCYRGERGGNLGYAIRHARMDGKVKTKYMHREIMNPPPGLEVIFLNHDRLDCRRENLRIVTKEEARRHHRVRHDSRTGVKGVRHNPTNDTYSAFTYRNGHSYRIGTFSSQEHAMQAYEEELRNENPDLAYAPERVERRVEDEQNPDAQG
jgi:hypothetical protein